MAADGVILTTERIVSDDQICCLPHQTKIAFFCVDAVVEAPFGIVRHGCYGVYEQMMQHMQRYVTDAELRLLGALDTDGVPTAWKIGTCATGWSRPKTRHRIFRNIG